GRLTEKSYDLYCIRDQGGACWLYMMYIQVHTQHAGQRHLSSSNRQSALRKVVTGTHQSLAYSFTQRPHRGGSTCDIHLRYTCMREEPLERGRIDHLSIMRTCQFIA